MNNYTLGSFYFSKPPGWRDDTTHVFRDPRSTGQVSIETFFSNDACEDISSASRRRYLAAWQNLIVYSERNEIAGTPSKIVTCDGEQLPLLGKRRLRFSIMSIADSGNAAILTLLGDSNPHFKQLAQKIGQSLRIRGTKEPLPSSNTARHAVSFVRLSLPDHWSTPTELIFRHTTEDEIEIRVARSMSFAAPGRNTLASAMLGTFAVIDEESVPLDHRGIRGWLSSSTLAQQPDMTKTIVKAAVLQDQRGCTLSWVGRAPGHLASALNQGWLAAMSSLESEGIA
jgi:hypothetical protein